MNRETIYPYITDRVEELDRYSRDGSAFFFLMASSFIDFLSCAVNDHSTDSTEGTSNRYRQFIVDRFGSINTIYQNDDVSLAIYCIMRNGLLHNFSFAPDHRGACNGIASSSIRKIRVFHVRNGNTAHDHLVVRDLSLWIGAEPFAQDIRNVTREILEDANIESNILSWCDRHPPLAPRGYFS
jgi:hypothetical protein